MLSIALVIAGLFAASSRASDGGRAYVAEGANASLAARFAPVFVVEHPEQEYNRIATPAAHKAQRAKNEIAMDVDHPALYWQETHFETAKGAYTNLFYRVHFARSPFTLTPFNASAGRNVGIMAVVTLDAAGRPVLVTTVHTCGCYHAILPTSLLPREDYPVDWDCKGLAVYGEHLPGLLSLPDRYTGDIRPVIHVRPGTHRVMDITVESVKDLASSYEVIETTLKPAESLKHLPMGDRETSLYFSKGYKRGLVKGAYKPWETLLFGWWVGDLHVGQDREYGSKEKTGRLFYTTLNPFKKHRADMSNYQGFLELNGWHL